MLFEDNRMAVVAKVMETVGAECLRLEQLLGVRPWVAETDMGATATMPQRSGGRVLWETLRLVPLAHGGLVRFARQCGVSALVMRRMITLTQLSRMKEDVRVLLRVVSQLVEVRCATSVAGVAVVDPSDAVVALLSD